MHASPVHWRTSVFGLPAILALLAWSMPARAASYLGSAASFAVLGSSTVTNTGPTTIRGDLGVTPGTAMPGLGSITIDGSVHAADAVAGLASTDMSAAAAALAALPFVVDLTGQDLGSVGVLSPGVYRFASSAQLTGNLTLDFAGDPDAAFIFQIGTSLTTASGSDVAVLNGGAGSGIYWIVGSSATLGTGSTLAGNILADVAVTMNTGARILCGRALAGSGGVTLDTAVISNDCDASALGGGRSDFGSGGFDGRGRAGPGVAVPEPAAWAMMVLGFGGVGGVMRRRRPVVGLRA